MLGISLLSIVVALGFEYLGRKCRGRARGQGGGESSAVQNWAALICYIISGMCWAVAAWPVVGQFGWKWLVVSAGFACLGLSVGTFFDLKKDGKPDGTAFMTARLLPTLLLITVTGWSIFTGTVGDQFGKYGDTLKTASIK